MRVSDGPFKSDTGAFWEPVCSQTLCFSKMMKGVALGVSQWVHFQKAAHLGLFPHMYRVHHDPLDNDSQDS